MGNKTIIPVYVLNGFLGSGKTTVLINMLSYCKDMGLKAGVILNELGDTNVERHLIETDQVIELLNGCICCTIQEDLRATLEQFMNNQNELPVDLLIIEGTGVANPLEIIEALTEPKYSECFELESIIGLVDASQYLEYQSIFSSSKEVRKLLQDQISYSNLLILNKTDLLSLPKLEKVEKQLRKSVPAVPIVKTAFGKIDIGELMEKRFYTYNLSENHHQHRHCGHHHEHGEDCKHHHHHSNHSTIKAIKLDQLPTFNRVTFEKWLLQLPKEIFRSKGIVQFEETPGYFDFQFASRQLKLNRLKAAANEVPCIVIIGIDFDEEKIKNSFSASFLQTTT